MPAVISLDFDPVLRLTEMLSVRVETVALAVVLFGGLLLAMRIGSVTPSPGTAVAPRGLNPGDLVLMCVAAIPAIVIGGRLGYVLDHVDFYRANPDAVLDPTLGSLSLTLAVPLGLLSGGLIGRLIGAPVARWMHAVALPLLFVLGAGKLVGVLGATGQGLPSDLPWATAYAGPGPWGSLAPDLPSHPAQVYEAVGVGIAMVVAAASSRLETLQRRDGALLFVALGLWAVVRIGVGIWWRDPAVLGPLRTEQLLALGVLVAASFGLAQRIRRERDPEDERLPNFDAERA